MVMPQVIIDGQAVHDLSTLPADVRRMVEALQQQVLRSVEQGQGSIQIQGQLSNLANMIRSGDDAAGKIVSESALLSQPADYVLGRAPTYVASSPAALARTLNIVKTQNAHDNYVMQEYVDGTGCEVAAGTPRYTQVRYFCDHQTTVPRVLELHEHTPCMYLIDIGVPSLCKLPLFTPSQRLLPETVCRVDEHAFQVQTPSRTRYHAYYGSLRQGHAAPLRAEEDVVRRREVLNSASLWHSGQSLGSRNIQSPGPKFRDWESLRDLV